MASDSKYDDPFNVQYWSNRWTENKIGFHKNYVNPSLLKYIDLVTGQKLTSEPLTDEQLFKANGEKTWFVPLCGKTLDIAYLLSQGFRVFGLDAVKMAIDSLEEEQKLGLTFDPESSMFTGVNGRLRIWVGDLFECPIENYGPFDYVWDRGSFIALEYPHREKYVEVMQRALKEKDGSWHPYRYLMETVLYDKSKFEGPPRSVADEDIRQYYDPWALTEMLSEETPPPDSSIFKKLEGAAKMRIFFIKPKL